MRNPHVLQLIMDSLRYWSWICTSTGSDLILLQRSPGSFMKWTSCRRSSTSSQQDPVISQVKLIAEPWDLGDGGYQVGNFLRCGPSGTASTAIPCGTLARRACVAGRVRLTDNWFQRSLRALGPASDGVDQLRGRP